MRFIVAVLTVSVAMFLLHSPVFATSLSITGTLNPDATTANTGDPDGVEQGKPYWRYTNSTRDWILCWSPFNLWFLIPADVTATGFMRDFGDLSYVTSVGILWIGPATDTPIGTFPGQYPGNETATIAEFVPSNITPSVPTLIFPANTSNTSDTTPTLSTNYSDADSGDNGTTNYRIATSADNCTNGISLVTSGTSSSTTDENENTTWTPSSSIGSDGTYYWCAQNDDGVAQSGWASMGSFTLDITGPAIPVASLSGGKYTPSRSVSLSSTGSTSIYYTLNNTTPTTSSTLYTSAIGVSESVTIKAVAIDQTGNESAIMTEEYIIEDAVPEKKKTKKIISLLGSTIDKKNKQPTISLPQNGSLSAKAADSDQIKKVTMKIGNTTFILRNTGKKDKGTFTTTPGQFKHLMGRFNYVLTADYGYTQVRERGIIKVTDPKNTVLINDVNKNFREIFGRNPIKLEWVKWAKEVQKGITKQELQKRFRIQK